MPNEQTPAPSPAPSPTPSPAPTPTPAPGGDVLGRGEQQQQQDQQQQQQNAAPEWLAGLTKDELKGDRSLANFKTLDDLAEGYVETKRLASSKVTLPKDGDPESFARFAAAIRPEKADAYEIEVPEGQGAEFADAMRPAFHEAGLHPEQVKKLVAANNAYAAQAAEAGNQRGRDELTALESEMGKAEFTKGKQAAVQMLDRLGIKADFENDLARFIGGGNTLRLLFSIAEKTGELGRVHADDLSLATGNLKGPAAVEAARAMMSDPATAAKLVDQNSPERKRYDKLLIAASQ